MNQPYIFHPFWHFVNSTNYFPLYQVNSLENYLVSNQNLFNSNSTDQNNNLEINSNQDAKQTVLVQKKLIQRRKNLRKTKQDRNFSYRYQDKDRNIYSNILKGFVIKVREDKSFQGICQKAIENLKLQLTLDDLIQYLNQNFQKNKTYISPACMKRALKGQGKPEIRRVLRVLLSKYLKQGFILVLLCSQRIQKQSKVLQMEKARQLWRQIYDHNSNGKDMENRKNE